MNRPRLSKTQADALARIQADGVLYSFNGVSRATIARLEELGLIRVEWKTTWRYGVLSTTPRRPQLEFVARPV